MIFSLFGVKLPLELCSSSFALIAISPLKISAPPLGQVDLMIFTNRRSEVLYCNSDYIRKYLTNFVTKVSQLELTF